MFAALLVLPACGFGQNYGEDMKKVMGKFSTGDISYHMKYCFYPYDSVKRITDSMSTDCYQSGQNYYYKIHSGKKEFEYYRNDRYFFVVDHSESAIAVKKNTEAQQQMWDMKRIDSLMHAPGVKVTYKTSGNDGEYDIAIKGGTWNKYRIIFNKSDYTLEKIYMNSSSSGKLSGTNYKKPMIVMYFSGYSEKQIDKSVFSESKVFSDTNDAIVLNDNYKKYKLLDYIYKLSKRS
jgi:hypothetical protein